MKKLLKWIATASVAIALIGASFTSCSNLVDDATIDGGSTSTGAKNVTITASSQDDIVTFGNGSSRMIMPGQLNATEGFKFWLFGTNKTTGTSLTATGTEVTLAAASGTTTKGTVTLDLDIAQYELSLYMIASSTTSLSDEADAKSKAVLAATALADFTHSDSVNFYLTPYSLSANGAYDLTLYLDGWTLASNYTSTVGIYSLTEMSVVSGTTETTFYYNDDTTNTPKWTSTAPASANFTSGSGYGVAPGTYNFVVTFTNSSTNKSYCYNDKIVILSNQRTAKTIAIPNVIEALPVAPSAFGVSYLNPVSTDDEYYEVQFEWTDGSYNETNFKIELVDFTNVTSTSDFEGYVKTVAAATGAHTDALDTAWTSFTTSSTDYSSKEIQYNFTKKITSQTPGASSTTSIEESFYNASSFWVDGSCFINSTTATIRLPLEHRYLARLCAQNDAGDSDYVYADIIGSTVTASTGYKRYGITAVAATSLAKFGADASSINRFRIRYYLNGGTFYATTAPITSAIPTPTGSTQSDWTDLTSTVTGITPTKDAVVVYGTQRNSDTSTVITNLFNPLLASAADSKVAVLYQDTNRWTGWLVGSVSGTTYTNSTNYNAVATSTYSATDPAAVVYKDWDTSTNAISTKYLALGSTNIDLYATYRITSGNWYTDESAEYDIQDNWVKIYSSPTQLVASDISTGTEASSANQSNGTYVYTKSNSAGSDDTAPNAYYLYVLLANDATNNLTNAGNGITYNTVAVDVLYKGTTSKARGTSTATTTVNYNLSGNSAEDIIMSYVEIPLQSLPVGKYQLMIYAHADTQQGIYTYPIAVEIRDGQ
mgnify:CR=1 FL=1